MQHTVTITIPSTETSPNKTKSSCSSSLLLDPHSKGLSANKRNHNASAAEGADRTSNTVSQTVDMIRQVSSEIRRGCRVLQTIRLLISGSPLTCIQIISPDAAKQEGIGVPDDQGRSIHEFMNDKIIPGRGGHVHLSMHSDNGLASQLRVRKKIASPAAFRRSLFPPELFAVQFIRLGTQHTSRASPHLP